jgi:hypothetical protein
MDMRAFSHFEKSKNQFKLLQHLTHDINEPGLKSIFIAKLCVVLNFCILINNELTPVQKPGVCN